MRKFGSIHAGTVDFAYGAGLCWAVMVYAKSFKSLFFYMYIVAIAWIYVVFMMAITEQTATAGVMTFLLYGVFPLTIVLYLIGTPQRKRNRQRAEQRKRMLSQTEASPGKNPETHELDHHSVTKKTEQTPDSIAEK